MDVRRRQDGQREGLPSSLARGIIGQKVQKRGEEPSRAEPVPRKGFGTATAKLKKESTGVGEGLLGRGWKPQRRRGRGDSRDGRGQGVKGKEREDAGIPLQSK